MDLIFKLIIFIFGALFVGAAAATVYAMVTMSDEDIQALSDHLRKNNQTKLLQVVIFFNKTHAGIKRIVAGKTKHNEDFEFVRTTTVSEKDVPDHIREQLKNTLWAQQEVTDQLPKPMTH